MNISLCDPKGMCALWVLRKVLSQRYATCLSTGISRERGDTGERCQGTKLMSGFHQVSKGPKRGVFDPGISEYSVFVNSTCILCTWRCEFDHQMLLFGSLNGLRVHGAPIIIRLGQEDVRPIESITRSINKFCCNNKCNCQCKKYQPNVIWE